MGRIARLAVSMSPFLAVAAYLAYTELVVIPATQARWRREQHEAYRISAHLAAEDEDD